MRLEPRASDKRSLFERVVEFLSPGPDSRAELIETLADAEHRELIAPESRIMLEGVIRMADMIAGDVMVAAPRMDLLDIDAPYDELLAVVIETSHSRFPVYEGQRDNIIGILLAKDLLKLQRAPELNLRTLVNGQQTQHGNTRDLVHGIPALIEYLSGFMTLNPGDVILTGTPEGVVDVNAGDEVVTEIEDIGRLVNTIVDDAAFGR